MDGGQQRLRHQRHQLRAAGQLPRHRHRLPERQVQPGLRALVTAGAGPAGGVRAGLPGDPGHPVRPASVSRPVRHPGTPPPGQPGRDLRAEHGGDGRFRPGRGPAVRHLRAAQGLPAGRLRQHRGHRGVHAAVLPGTAAGGLGRDRGGRPGPAAGAVGPVVAVRGGRGRGHHAGHRVGGPAPAVVAVLQDLRAAQRQGAPRAVRVGEQHPLPGGPLADRAAPAEEVLLLPVPARDPVVAEERPDRRGRHRQRRRGRAVRGRAARGRGGDRPGADQARPQRAPQSPVRQPPGDHAQHRRPGLPAEHHAEVQPDPVRPARLADRGQRAVQPAAGELPAHPAVGPGGPGAPGSRRHHGHVQLLLEPPVQPVRDHHAGRVRAGALRPGGSRRSAAGGWPC